MKGGGEAGPDLPWFPLWVDDFRGSRSVKLMSIEAVGLFTLLLCEQWTDGPIPDDLEAVALLCGRHPEAIADAWAEVRQRFTETPEGLVNGRLERERKRQLSKHRRRVEAGKRGAQARWGQGDDSNASADALRKEKQPEPEPEEETEVTDKPHRAKKRDPLRDQFPAKPPKRDGRYKYPPEFDEAWDVYPDRRGNNPKLGAYKAWRARVVTGDDPGDMATAAENYAAHVRREGKEGTEFVSRGATFWGESEPWREWVEPNDNGADALHDDDRRMISDLHRLDDVDLEESFR